MSNYAQERKEAVVGTTEGKGEGKGKEKEKEKEVYPNSVRCKRGASTAQVVAALRVCPSLTAVQTYLKVRGYAVTMKRIIKININTGLV